MQKYIVLIAFLFSALITWSQPKQEVRAVWITTLGGMDWPQQKAGSAIGIERQKRELCEQLDQYKAAHFNTILFQVRLRGDVIYPSTYETFSEALTGHTGKNPGYDPLAFAIEECHKRGMEFHAWLVTIPIGNKRQIKILGKNSIVHKKPSICKQHQGGWYLNPGHPETKHYLASIAQEIVAKYDVDGIHLDYIRYPEGAEKFPDADTFRMYGKGKSLNEWRRENITAIVREIYQQTKSLKPWVKVSSSPVGKYRDTNRYTSRGWNAYYTVHQDVRAWLEEGIHDAIFPMMYFQGNNFYPFALDWKENNNKRWVVPGLGIYFLSPKERDWPLDEITRQIYFIRRNGLNGQAFFRGRFLLNNTKGVFDELKLMHYTAPALLPPLTWLDSIPPTTPSSPQFKVQGEKNELTWQASTDNNNLPVAYHIYASENYPVDTNNPNNLLETSYRYTNYSYTSLSQHQLFFAVTATDRYGNESSALELNKPDNQKLPLLNRGNTLYLPAANAKSYQVVNAMGGVVLKGAYQDHVFINSLPIGFYQVILIDANGKKETVGYILN
ncbi:MAG: glycoside hydrolase family 10 protein [Phocaeicola sp.]